MELWRLKLARKYCPDVVENGEKGKMKYGPVTPVYQTKTLAKFERKDGE